MKEPWSAVPLGDVLHLSIDSVRVNPLDYYKISGVYSFGRGLLARGPLLGAETTYKVLHRLHENDFVISHLKAWEGALARVTASFDDWFLSPQFSTFRPDPDRLEIAYLEWYCKQSKVWEALRNKARGMGARRDSVLPSQFLALSIPLPSVEEQRQIVARIEELAGRIEEARELRRRAVEETDALFRKALKMAFEPFIAESVAIGDAFKVTTGGTPSRANPLFWDGNIKWVSSGEVAFCRINDTTEKITELGVENSNAKLYPPNTVLIAMIGQGKTRGQCAILDCNAATNQNIAGIHVYESEHLPEFVYWWLFSRYYESRLAETGTAQPALSGTRVKQMPIPLPSTQEQHIVVDFLNNLQSKLDALKRHQAETAAELDALMPSILDRAFRGEL